MTVEEAREHVFRYRELQAAGACREALQVMRKHFPKGTRITRASLGKFNSHYLAWFWRSVVRKFEPHVRPYDSEAVNAARELAQQVYLVYVRRSSSMPKAAQRTLMVEAILYFLNIR